MLFCETKGGKILQEGKNCFLQAKNKSESNCCGIFCMHKWSYLEFVKTLKKRKICRSPEFEGVQRSAGSAQINLKWLDRYSNTLNAGSYQGKDYPQ